MIVSNGAGQSALGPSVLSEATSQHRCHTLLEVHAALRNKKTGMHYTCVCARYIQQVGT